MKQTQINWRKATDEELKNGSDEMIKVSEEEIDVPDIIQEPVALTDEQLILAFKRLKELGVIQ